MTRTMIAVIATALLGCQCAAAATPEPAELMRPGIGDWCYSPIGKLSPTIKADYVDFIVEQAIAVQKKYNVPGAIIAGMSIQESGYGRTRLAILSNNILSFKKPSDPAWTFDRPTFVLWCQPAYDKGNNYLHFGSKAAAFDYVAKVFAERTALKVYFEATKQYKASIASGSSREQAGIAWLRQISPTYTADADYIDRVLRFVNNPLAEAQPNPDKSLWYRVK